MVEELKRSCFGPPVAYIQSSDSGAWSTTAAFVDKERLRPNCAIGKITVADSLARHARLTVLGSAPQLQKTGLERGLGLVDKNILGSFSGQ